MKMNAKYATLKILISDTTFKKSDKLYFTTFTFKTEKKEDFFF